MHEFFWREDEDAVLVLEFLRTEFTAVIKEAAAGDGGSGAGGLAAGEIKSWMMQVLSGVHSCHRNMIAHRDLKPGNLLISDDGMLKLVDFGQARILMDTGFDATVENPPPPYVFNASNLDNWNQTGFGNQEEGTVSHEEYFRVLDEMKNKSHTYDRQGFKHP